MGRTDVTHVNGKNKGPGSLGQGGGGERGWLITDFVKTKELHCFLLWCLKPPNGILMMKNIH